MGVRITRVLQMQAEQELCHSGHYVGVQQGDGPWTHYKDEKYKLLQLLGHRHSLLQAYRGRVKGLSKDCVSYEGCS